MCKVERCNFILSHVEIIWSWGMGALGKAETSQCHLEKAQASPFSPPSLSHVFLECRYCQKLSSYYVLLCWRTHRDLQRIKQGTAGSGRALRLLLQSLQRLPSMQWNPLPPGVTTGLGNRSFPPFTLNLSSLFTKNWPVRLHFGLILFYQIKWLVLPSSGWSDFLNAAGWLYFFSHWVNILPWHTVLF